MWVGKLNHAVGTPQSTNANTRLSTCRFRFFSPRRIREIVVRPALQPTTTVPARLLHLGCNACPGMAGPLQSGKLAGGRLKPVSDSLGSVGFVSKGDKKYVHGN